MAGISTKAFGKLENRFKYNGKELQKDFDINVYDYGARMQDPQLGRMNQIDPMADKWNSYSTYNYCLNNPINVVDPDGRNAVYTLDEEKKKITISAKIYYQGKDLAKGDEARAKFIDGINKDIKSVFKDGTAKIGDVEYTVSFDITASINENIKVGDLKEDENIMTVDKEQTKVDDGSYREHVGGEGKGINEGFVKGSSSMGVNTHEIGHMLGLNDRYTDYENSKDIGNWGSIAHEGYQSDKMGRSSNSILNQSHYDQIVEYTVGKLIQAQSNLLPAYKDHSLKIKSMWDNIYRSSVNSADVKSGWQVRQVKIK